MTWTAEQATHELLRLLPLLSRLVSAEVRAAAGEDTTMPQFRVLALLAEEPQTPSALARYRRVSLQAMSVLVQSLVARGWVTRTPDPHDRRQQVLALTDRGRDHCERAQARLEQRLVPLLALLTADELAAVEQALPALGRIFAQDEPLALPAALEAQSRWN